MARPMANLPEQARRRIDQMNVENELLHGEIVKLVAERQARDESVEGQLSQAADYRALYANLVEAASAQTQALVNIAEVLVQHLQEIGDKLGDMHTSSTNLETHIAEIAAKLDELIAVTGQQPTVTRGP